MQEDSGQQGRGRRGARGLVFAVAAVVAMFSFIVSYSHIYDLGRAHAQSGTAARLLPLTVDLLIVAASLVLFIQDRPSLARGSLAFWMPRFVLYAAIGATVAANVAYGLPSGWLSAVISGWPGAAFVAAVEVGILVAGPVNRGRDGSLTSSAPRDAVPAASGRVSLPKSREIQARQGCSPTTAGKALKELSRYRDRVYSPAEGSPTPPSAGVSGQGTQTPGALAALNGQSRG
jgi:hypothetical protein